MTERQRDLLALYFIHMGITDPRKMKYYIKDYLGTREVVGLCCEEIAQKENHAIQKEN